MDSATSIVIPETGHPLIDTTIRITLGTLTAGWIFWNVIKPRITAFEKNLQDVVEQTANRHQDAPYPNLRDNIDANQEEVLGKLSEVTSALKGVQENVLVVTMTVNHLSNQVDVMQKDIGGLKEENRNDRKETQERFLLLEQKER